MERTDYRAFRGGVVLHLAFRIHTLFPAMREFIPELAFTDDMT